MTKPNVVTTMGAIIEPIVKEDFIKEKTTEKTGTKHSSERKQRRSRKRKNKLENE